MRRVAGLPTVISALLCATLFLLTNAAQDVNGNPALRLSAEAPIDSPGTYYSQTHPCPAACLDNKPENWTVYSSVDRLALCGQPMLFDLAIHNPVDAPGSTVKIRACTAGEAENANTTVNAVFAAINPANDNTNFKRSEAECLTTTSETNFSLEFAQRGSGSATGDGIAASLEHLQRYFDSEANCDASIMFGYSNGTIAGVYSGSSFGKRSVSAVIKRFMDQVETDGSADTMVAQLCGDDRNAHHVLGVAVDTTGDLAAVQTFLRSWSAAECISGFDATSPWEDLSLWESEADLKPLSGGNSKRGNHFHRRGDCSTITVAFGDSCPALASRCGITPAKFTEYNDDPSLCSSLIEGQRVCCSAGTLPDIRPKPNKDGSCASYTVIADDNCKKLAVSNGLTQKQLEKFNNGTTWGWNGCEDLLAGVNICLSKGDPPMPAPIPNAICGPTKPGTKRPTDDTDLADLNPCPLNVCCNIWGQCGITSEFCLEERGPSGNPGTSPPGTDGCVSSCGTNITNNDDAPSSFGRIGYYETWNFNRSCLHLRSRHANTDGSYTHVHWAFAEIDTSDFSVKIVDDYNQWDEFKNVLSAKKIISFGGWGYSTEAETYNILREAMSPANRAKFATNIADFLEDEEIDGVDFDWEYPGATDIDGTPPGLPSDGPNYLKFLTTMRSKLPDGKTLSIAAPASYWYLKAFPISKMAKQLDYIVFMTYDLHGQWDAGNQYTQEGCPGGNCLRSHVNLTETTYTLSMITKAGVPANKIFVGEVSYGRSFKMSKEGCTGPMCTFEGGRLDSKAAPGECTDTPGYIADAEINYIIAFEEDVETWHDGASNSDLMVYRDTEWVAYMTKTTKDTRRSHWKGLNFAGTIDWAVDLQKYTDDEGWTVNGTDYDIMPELSGDKVSCTGSYDTLGAIEADLDNIPKSCETQYLLQFLQKNLTDSLDRYDTLMENGYDDYFNTYANAVVDSSNKVVEDFMLDNGDDYFSCIVTETVSCCKYCNSQYTNENDRKINCRYCEEYDCVRDSVCDNPGVHCDPMEFRYRNYTQPCPPDYSERGQTKPAKGDHYVQSVYWTLEDDKSDQFWADLYSETGVAEEDITWKNVHHWQCAPTDKHCGDRDWDYDFPVPDGYDKSDVSNPKDVVSEARKKLKNLAPQLKDAVKEIKKGTYLPSADDLVDAVSLPVLMVSDAIESMESIVDIAEEIEEAKEKAILMAFLSAIFLFVPIVGEVIGSISSLATIGRIVALMGNVGNAALDIYTIVDDKDNAPLAIFNLILAPLALVDIAAVAKAANYRRGMSADDISKLGEKLGTRMTTISRIKDRCPL